MGAWRHAGRKSAFVRRQRATDRKLPKQLAEPKRPFPGAPPSGLSTACCFRGGGRHCRMRQPCAVASAQQIAGHGLALGGVGRGLVHDRL